MKKLQRKATELRRHGKSYNEISKELFVAKSTLSYWLKGIPLKKEYRIKFYNSRMRNMLLGSRSQKERRLKEINHIIDEAGREIKKPISFESMRLMGAALYWAEGTKRGMCEITNSDPQLIAFSVQWIQAVFGLNPKDLKARLNIYPQQSDVKIKRFWSEITEIPVKRFGKTFVKPFSSGYKKNNLYYGTIKIEVPKSVDLKYRIFGWIKSALSDISPHVKLTQERWSSLMSVERPVPVNLK